MHAVWSRANTWNAELHQGANKKQAWFYVTSLPKYWWKAVTCQWCTIKKGIFLFAKTNPQVFIRLLKFCMSKRCNFFVMNGHISLSYVCNQRLEWYYNTPGVKIVLCWLVSHCQCHFTLRMKYKNMLVHWVWQAKMCLLIIVFIFGAQQMGTYRMDVTLKAACYHYSCYNFHHMHVLLQFHVFCRC